MTRIGPAVLIIDEDLKFAFWLARLLNGLDYQAWPARNGADAAALLKEMNGGPDLVVVNPDSNGAAGFVADLRRQRQFKTIAIQLQDDRREALDGVDASLVKPQSSDRLSELEWTHAIERVLAKSDTAGPSR